MARLSNNDLPTLDTQLETKSFIERLARDVESVQPPKTFSLTGCWGAGKTSALAQLFVRLTGKSPEGFELPGDHESSSALKCEGIWFEAWRYQNEEAPIVALLHTIKSQFSTKDKFIDSAGKLGNVAFLGAISVLDSVIKSTTGLSGLSNVQGIGEKYEKDNLLSRLASDQINDALKRAVDVIIGNGENGGDRKLIIFIDDLDRCEPEAAFRLLEGIKLYLSIPNCVIVMAMDQNQIEANLVNRQGVEGSRFYGVEYIEKLCQDSYRLPVPNAVNRSKFLIEHIRCLSPQTDAVYNSKILDLEKVLEKYDCLPANPRRLKMLANNIAAFYSNTDSEKIPGLDEYLLTDEVTILDKSEMYALAIIIVSSLYVSYRRLYERLETCPSFVNEIIEFCSPEPNNSYSEKDSVFYEFDKSNTRSKAAVDHPSDLSVFRLKVLFSENPSGMIKTYKLKDQILGDITHQLIQMFNYPDSYGQGGEQV
jgi:hypothetical protein